MADLSGFDLTRRWAPLSTPTEYAGVLMRSKLETRWAAFFDAHGIDWIYEPTTYRMGRVYYKPDFLLDANFILTDHGGGAERFRKVFVEVKPDGVYSSKARTLAEERWQAVVLANGEPSQGASYRMFTPWGEARARFADGAVRQATE